MKQKDNTKITFRRNVYLKFMDCFFLFAQFTFGINFGFTLILKRKYHTVAYLFTHTVSFIWVCLCIVVIVSNPSDFWAWVNVTKYVIFLFVVNAIKYNVYNLIAEINLINEMTPSDQKYLCAIPIGYWFILNAVKIFLMTVRCMFEKDAYCSKFSNLGIYIAWVALVVSLDSIGVTQTVIYYYINCCIKNIKDSSLMPNMKLKSFEKRYLALTSCYNKIRPLYDTMILLELGLMVPKMMVTIWSVMYYLNEKANWYSYMTEVVFAFHLAIQICTPAIVAEMANSQIDLIKQILREKLLEEIDERTFVNVKHALQLITTKRINHLVLRFIPIDLSLLLALFSICSTYFIVVVQFSHFYD